MPKFKFLFAILLIIASISFSSCEDGVNINNINIFTTDDDVQLGKDLDTQIAGNPQEYPIYNNTDWQNYVNSIRDEIVKSKYIEYKDKFPYKMTLINSKTVNAFATPGGYIYIYTGLLKFIDNEATLAAIIAHEIAHAERRHATKRLTKQYGVSLMLDIVLGTNSDALTEIGANLVTGLGFLWNSREDEYEADEYSFNYLLNSKYYPGASTYFFDKIKNANQSSIEELLSTHPMDQKRIDAINKFITDNKVQPASESNLFGTKYSQMKSILPN